MEFIQKEFISKLKLKWGVIETWRYLDKNTTDDWSFINKNTIDDWSFINKND